MKSLGGPRKWWTDRVSVVGALRWASLISDASGGVLFAWVDEIQGWCE